MIPTRGALALALTLTLSAPACSGPMRLAGDELTGTGQFKEPPAPPPPTERPLALLGQRARLAVPLTWRVTREEYTPQSGTIELRAPRPGVPGGEAEVRVRAEIADESTALSAEADDRNARPLADTREGDSWRTVVWIDESDASRALAVIERIGRAQKSEAPEKADSARRARVHLRAAFPLVEPADPAWLERLVADLNDVLASLTLDGETRFEAPITVQFQP